MTATTDLSWPVTSPDGANVGTLRLPVVWEQVDAPDLSRDQIVLAARTGTPMVTIDTGRSCDGCPADVVVPVATTVEGEHVGVGELACCASCAP